MAKEGVVKTGDGEEGGHGDLLWRGEELAVGWQVCGAGEGRRKVSVDEVAKLWAMWSYLLDSWRRGKEHWRGLVLCILARAKGRLGRTADVGRKKET